MGRVDQVEHNSRLGLRVCVIINMHSEHTASLAANRKQRGVEHQMRSGGRDDEQLVQSAWVFVKHTEMDAVRSGDGE